MENNNIKTRDLSYYQYFNQLQLEFIVAELRKKIYPSQKDKLYYQKVMEGKRKRIEDIALRNSLKSIFISEEEKNNKYQQIYTSPFPQFLYRDEREREKQEYKDKIFYYMKGSEVKVTDHNSNTVKIGTLAYIILQASTAKVEYSNGETEIVSLNAITRIL